MFVSPPLSVRAACAGKAWIFNPKGSAIQIKLDAIVAHELTQLQLPQVREHDAAREVQAMRQRELQETLEETWQMQAQRDSLLRQAREQAEAQARAARQEPVQARLPTLHYRLRDGAILLQHERDGGILLDCSLAQSRAAIFDAAAAGKHRAGLA